MHWQKKRPRSPAFLLIAKIFTLLICTLILFLLPNTKAGNKDQQQATMSCLISNVACHQMILGYRFVVVTEGVHRELNRIQLPHPCSVSNPQWSGTYVIDQGELYYTGVGHVH